MDNSPRLPAVSIVVAVVLAAVAAAQPLVAGPGSVSHLSEIQIGLVGIALTLAVYGIQGIISVALEGRRLVPGRHLPRLTDPLTYAILVLVAATVANAVWLALSVTTGAGTGQVGLSAGLGFVALALLLVVYKVAFVGDEARFDRRDDGVPW